MKNLFLVGAILSALIATAPLSHSYGPVGSGAVKGPWGAIGGGTPPPFDLWSLNLKHDAGSGAPSYVQLASVPAALSATSPWTFSTWIYVTAFPTIRYWSVLDDSRTATQSGLLIAVFHVSGQPPDLALTPFVQYRGTASDAIEALANNHTIALNTLTNLGVTNDGTGLASGLKIYLQGVDVTVSTDGTLTTTPAASTPLYFNYNNVNTNSSADASYDETSIWSVKFSAADMAALYAAGRGSNLATNSHAANLVSWYRFEKTGLSPADSATTVRDRAGTNNGTLTNIVIGDYITPP